MDINNAVTSLRALAQESRLSAFRLLVQAGSEGLPAGDIARSLGIPHNTLSTHIASLERGGLVQSRRDGRSLIYSIDERGTRALLAYLLEDCCKGTKATCRPALASALSACC